MFSTRQCPRIRRNGSIADTDDGSRLVAKYRVWVVTTPPLDLVCRSARTTARRPGSASADPAGPRPDPADDPSDLDHWAALHAAVDGLPVDQREVFGLTFYHRWTQGQIAELLGVDARAVRRRWRAAGAALAAVLGGDRPDFGDSP